MQLEKKVSNQMYQKREWSANNIDLVNKYLADAMDAWIGKDETPMTAQDIALCATPEDICVYSRDSPNPRKYLVWKARRD